MKKVNNKGFMLVETLIVSTFLLTVLLFIYIQFNNITKTYDASFKYNTVNGLYAVNNVVSYISNDGLDKLKTSSSSEPIDMTSCPSEYFNEVDYCTRLLATLKVKKAVFIDSDLTSKVKENNSLDQAIIDFIDYIGPDKTSGYRVILEFNDNTLSSLKIGK